MLLCEYHRGCLQKRFSAIDRELFVDLFVLLLVYPNLISDNEMHLSFQLVSAASIYSK